MDVFLLPGSSLAREAGELPVTRWLCQNVGFFWDGTGSVNILAKNPHSGAPEAFEVCGRGRVEGTNWRVYVGGEAEEGWHPDGIDLTHPSGALIHIGLNYVSWYQQVFCLHPGGAPHDVWIIGTGIRPLLTIDIGRPLFQFQIGIEPPGA